MKFQLTLNLVLAALALIGHAVPISSNDIATKTAQGLRLLSLAEGVEPVWKTEDEKLELMRAGVKFVRLHSQFTFLFIYSDHYFSSM